MKPSFPFFRRSLISALFATGLVALSKGAGIYDSGGFESPVFLLEQSLDGQDPPPPLGNGSWAQDNGSSVAVVTAANAIDGAKSIKITRSPGASGNTRWGVVKAVSPAVPDNVVDIRFDMQVVQKTNEYGPLFGIEAYGSVLGAPKLIGSLLHDASTGELVCQRAGSGAYTGTGFYPDLKRHQHYRLSLNFTARTCSLFANDQLVHTEGFVNPSVTNFTDAPLVTVAAGSVDETGSAYIDNYRIDSTTSKLPYLLWRGDGSGNVWDLNLSANWHDGIGAGKFATGSEVRFDNSGSAAPAIELRGNLQPSAVKVSSSQAYAFAGSGTITGTTGLLKEGSGTLSLHGANSYSGNTTVNAGELSVRNSSGSATGSGSVSVAALAKLSGNGRIGGAVAVAAGGVVMPGVGTGTLRIDKDLVLDGAVLKFDLGTTSDRLTVAGDLDLGGSLEITDAGGLQAGTYPLITYGGELLAGSFVLTRAPEGFRYRIDSGTPGVVSLVVTPPPPPPLAPDLLEATPAGKDAITLDWQDRSGDEEQFMIERSADGVAFTLVASVAANTSSFSDGGLASGQTYYYRVSAGNSGGVSGYSNVASARTLISPALAYLKFDESGGTTAFDSSPNGHDGTLVGGPVWVSGQFDNGLDLDGVDDHVTLPAGVTAGLHDFTVATWVKLDSLDNWARVIDFGSSTANYMFLTPSNGATRKLRFAISTSGGSGEQIIESPSALPVGTWTHVAVTLSGKTGTLYVNGSPVGTNHSMTLSPSSLGATANNYIGKSQYPDPYLNGQVDEFQLHDRALAAAEVAALAHPGTPRAPGGLTVVAGDGRVELSWNAVNGATSYNVYRSTGNGYALIASGLTSAAFTDDSAVNGTAYSYVVTASNEFGESAFSAPFAATPFPDADYSGRAVVVSGNAAGIPFTWGDTGELPEEGGSRQSSFLAFDEADAASGEIGHASVIGQVDRTRAEASVGGVTLNANGILIEADFAMARALAVFQSGGSTGLAGVSEIGTLHVAGTPVVVTGEPNQSVALPNGRVVINEQIVTDSAITVNAIHVVLDAGLDLVVASARAGYQSVQPPPPGGDDSITGGGWIPGPDDKRSFGFSGGFEDGVLSGHLTFKDHHSGMKVEGVTVTSYGPGATANSRRIEGTAKVDGAGGFTYRLEAADNGEPGDADTFSIDLSNGYHADGLLGGGNIQLHGPGE
jgi:autotransporter-associated beta strand protein